MRFLPFLLCCLFLAAAILPRPASAALRPERLAYGKHGKAVRWHIVALYIDCAMSITAIAAMLNGKTRKKLINAKTVQRILEIFRTSKLLKKVRDLLARSKFLPSFEISSCRATR